jgi:hypothetical protein
MVLDYYILMPIPGSRLSFAGGGLVGGQLGIAGSKVWYHYYDSTMIKINV